MAKSYAKNEDTPTTLAMDIHLIFPQDKWTPWRSLPPTDFPLLPLPFPVAKLSQADQADENTVHFMMNEIHRIYCDQSTVLRVNPQTKPFLAMLLHVYTVCGDMQEELSDTREKLTKMTALLHEINKLVVEGMQRVPAPMSSPAGNSLSKAITTWRRKKMFLTTLKRQEPLLLQVARIGRDLNFLKGWKDKSVLHVIYHLVIKRAAIVRVIRNAEEQMAKIDLPDNQRVLNDFERLQLTRLMAALKRAFLREQLSLLEDADLHFFAESIELEPWTPTRLGNDPECKNLESRQYKRYLMRLGFQPRKWNRQLSDAFVRLDQNDYRL